MEATKGPHALVLVAGTHLVQNDPSSSRKDIGNLDQNSNLGSLTGRFPLGLDSLLETPLYCRRRITRVASTLGYGFGILKSNRSKIALVTCALTQTHHITINEELQETKTT